MRGVDGLRSLERDNPYVMASSSRDALRIAFDDPEEQHMKLTIEAPLLIVIAAVGFLAAEQVGSSQILPPCNNDCHMVTDVCNRIPSDTCMKYEFPACDWCAGANASCSTNPTSGNCVNSDAFQMITGYTSCVKQCTSNHTDARMTGQETANAIVPYQVCQ